MSEVNFNSRLALGTVQFGLSYGIANTSGQVKLDEAANILAYAKNKNLDTIDTAIAYGQSEEVLGQLGIENWNIVSKLPEVPISVNSIKNWVFEQVSQSIYRLGSQHLYGLLLHRPDQLLGSMGDELYEALISLKQEGLVKKIGVSIYNYEELIEITKCHSFDLVQAPLNIMDRSFVDSGWASRLKDQNIEIHVRSIFLQGLLLMGSERPVKFSRWHNIWNQWDSWLAMNKISALEACLGYVFSVPEVDKVIVGIESLDQLLEILAAVKYENPNIPPPFWCGPIDPDLINPAKWNNL